MNRPREIRRVLMTGDTVGGVWTFTLELAEALGKLGVQVALATMGGLPSPTQRREAARISNLRHFPSDFKLEWMDDPWCDVEVSAGWLHDVAADFAPDVIHLNTYGHGTVVGNVPTVLTAHSCVLSWWRAVHGQEAPTKWSRYRQVVKQALTAAREVTAPTPWMLSSLEENYGPLAHARVIPNGRSAAKFTSVAAPFASMNEVPCILTVGRIWDRAKNTALLGGIATSLDWPVYVAGECSHPNGGSVELRGCRMLGQLSADEVGHWYSRAAIYASPAKYEPFGLCALEAALSGCALVLSDIPTLREIWDEAALFFAPDDADAWRVGLNALIADPGRRCALALRARRRALELTPERMAQEYLSCYADAFRERERERACAL
jgi:glycosyltransferase involved in cell wall biosynthesis